MRKRTFDDYHTHDMAVEYENSIPSTSSSFSLWQSPPSQRRKLQHVPHVNDTPPIFFNHLPPFTSPFDTNRMNDEMVDDELIAHTQQHKPDTVKYISQSNGSYSSAHIQHLEYIKAHYLNNSPNKRQPPQFSKPMQHIIPLVPKPVENFIDVTVKCLNGKSLNIMIDFNNCDVHDLKQIIYRRSGFAVDKQRLVYQGRQLPDSLNLRDSLLEQGSILHLVMALRGGAFM
jgi:ubiquitin-like protein Nedd8